MPEQGKISLSQFTTLVLLFMVGTSTSLSPYIVVNMAKQDAWISALVGIGLGFLLVLLYGILVRRHPKMTLIESSETILGKWIGKIVSFLFFLYFLILTSGLVRVIGDFITTNLMPETPIQAIEIIFILTVIFAVRLGLETFSRTSEIILPVVFLFFLFTVLFLIPEIRFENIAPILEDGIKPVLRGAFQLLGVPILDIVTLLMITPYVDTPKQIGKALIIATMTGGIFIFLIIIFSILVLGPGSTSNLNYPIYALTQKINIGNFIQRIEVLAGGILFISMFIKTTICFYSMVLSFAQIFRLKKYEMLTFPLGMIVLVLSIILFPNIIYFNMFILKAWTPFVLIYGVFLPVILLVVDTVKKRFKKRNTDSIGK